jgi:alpha-beta hydrolase superfamily lysophospholipase
MGFYRIEVKRIDAGVTQATLRLGVPAGSPINSPPPPERLFLHSQTHLDSRATAMAWLAALPLLAGREGVCVVPSSTLLSLDANHRAVLQALVLAVLTMISSTAVALRSHRAALTQRKADDSEAEFAPARPWVPTTSHNSLRHRHSVSYELLRVPRPGRPVPHLLLNVTRWLPQPAVSGVVVFVHGLNGHSTFADSALLSERLSDNGYAVLALDVEGHGRSGGIRGLVPDLQDVASDIAAVLLRAKELYPGQPLFLVGISMGGCASIHATLALQDAGTDLAALLTGGLILLCPLVHTVKQPPNSLKVAAQLLARLSPRLPLPTAHKPGNGVDIAHRELMRQAMAADGHIYTGGIRVGTALALLAAAEQAQQRLDELLLGHRVRLLILHGEADDVVDIAGSRELHSRSGATDKTFISYPDARHALLNEAPHVNTVMKDLLRWMLQRGSVV